MEEAVEIHFPSVHGDDAGDLIKLVCFANSDLKGMVKTTSGIDDDAARNIIGAARCGENHASLGTGVIVSVSTPFFSGRSYGLALALADKLLRYGAPTGNGRLIATGLIEPDGQGRVDAIDSFEAKLHYLLLNTRSGDRFFFPRANLDPQDEEQRQLLQQLRQSGVRWDALGHICEALPLLQPSGSPAETTPEVTTHKGFQPIHAILILAAGLALLLSLALWNTGESQPQASGTAPEPTIATETTNPATPPTARPEGTTEQPPLRPAALDSYQPLVATTIEETAPQNNHSTPAPNDQQAQTVSRGGTPTPKARPWMPKPVEIPTDAY